jgi:hypothetical protein
MAVLTASKRRGDAFPQLAWGLPSPSGQLAAPGLPTGVGVGAGAGATVTGGVELDGEPPPHAGLSDDVMSAASAAATAGNRR